MFGKIARGAYLLMLAVMIAAWAISTVKGEPSAPGSEPPVWIGWA